MVSALTFLTRRVATPNVLQSPKDLASVYSDLVRLRLVDQCTAKAFGDNIVNYPTQPRSSKEIALLISAMSFVKVRHDYIHYKALHILCNNALEQAKTFAPFELMTTFNAIKRLPKAIPASIVNVLAKRARDIISRFSDKEISLLLDFCGKTFIDGHSNEMESFITTLFARRGHANDFLQSVSSLRALNKQKTPCREYVSQAFEELRKNFNANLLTKEVLVILLHLLSSDALSVEDQRKFFHFFLKQTQNHRRDLHCACIKEISVCAAKMHYPHHSELDMTFDMLTDCNETIVDEYALLQVFTAALHLGYQKKDFLNVISNILAKMRPNMSQMHRAVTLFPRSHQPGLLRKLCNYTQELQVTEGTLVKDVTPNNSPNEVHIIKIGENLQKFCEKQTKKGVNLFDLIEFFELTLKSSKSPNVGRSAVRVVVAIDKAMKEDTLSSFHHFSFLNKSQILTVLRLLTTFRIYSTNFFDSLLQTCSQKGSTLLIDLEMLTYLGFIKPAVRDSLWNSLLERIREEIDKLDSFGAVQILVACMACQEKRIINAAFIARVIRHLLTLKSVGSTELAIAMHAMNRMYINEPVSFNTALTKYLSLPLDHLSIAKVYASVARYRFFDPDGQLVYKIFEQTLQAIPLLDHASLIKILVSTGSFYRLCKSASEESTAGLASTQEVRNMLENVLGRCANLKSINIATLAMISSSLSKIPGFTETLRTLFTYATNSVEMSLLTRTTFALAMMTSNILYGSFLASLVRQYEENVGLYLNFERLAFNAFVLYPLFESCGLNQRNPTVESKLLAKADELPLTLFHVQDLLTLLESSLHYTVHMIPKSLLVNVYNELRNRSFSLTSVELKRLRSLVDKINASGMLDVHA